MKAHLLTFALLALLGTGAHAQEADSVSVPFKQQFSLEIGTGMAPLHSLINLSRVKWKSGLADKGQEAISKGGWCPAFSLSAAWRMSRRFELALTGGVSWCHYQVIQYGTFGVDPQGKPRYDLKNRQGTFWTDSDTSFALFLQARRIWNPDQKVKLYSAFGFGAYTSRSEIVPFPSVTPIAVRFGNGPLKFYIEHTYSPAATAYQLGLGWTF